MDQVQHLGPYEAQFQEILSKGLDKTKFVDVTSHATPNTEFSAEHGLDRTPSGFIVINQDRAGHVYDSGTAWDAGKIFLKADVSSMKVRLMVF
jgi:hypothetical protein